MHLGWHRATEAFAEALAFPPGIHVLDIGSGAGGPARFFAERQNIRVTGIDITRDFVEAANALTRRCGLETQVAFREASALALPFADASFDAAYTIHVDMNIADKAQVFAEARRVLKPGARFGLYDVMHVGTAPLPYPMPWATSTETSFVETPETYRKLLAAAGFAIDTERDRTSLVLDAAREIREKAERDGPQPLGRETLAGPDWKERSANVMAALRDRIIAPIEILARAV
jgi:ubiquinone/menaquinone biosynthesis C-methylase UbiE